MTLVSPQTGYQVPTVAVASSVPKRGSGGAVLIVPVVGADDDTTGQAVVAFVILKSQQELITVDEAEAELKKHVASSIGAIARPRQVFVVNELPKTRSGKIMRRLLRVLAKGEEITQDISTLENPAILDQLKEAI